MTHHLSEEEVQKIARQRVEAKKGFFIHLAVYVIVNIFLAFVWWFTSNGEGYPWFLWVIAGWGVAIVINAVTTFIGPKHGSGWESREIKKEVERLKNEE
jgi:hypothetical protein